MNASSLLADSTVLDGGPPAVTACPLGVEQPPSRCRADAEHWLQRQRRRFIPRSTPAAGRCCSPCWADRTTIVPVRAGIAHCARRSRRCAFLSLRDAPGRGSVAPAPPSSACLATLAPCIPL